jgi:hypothetical protein
VRVRPVSWPSLVAELTERVAAGPPQGWVRLAVDGAPPARPGVLADALVDPLRVRGRPTLRVDAGDFLRPASLRLEYGRTNPDAFYQDWLDAGGLTREVLLPLRPGGTGRVLPSLWNAETDRASRAPYVTLPAGAVLLLSGPLLLGRGLELDLTVHLTMSAAALARRVDPTQRWTLPAYARYDAEVAPAGWADVVVRVDDLRRPAVVDEA